MLELRVRVPIEPTHLEVGPVSSRRERDGIFGPGFTSRPETIDPGIPGILMRTWLSKARRLIEVVPSQQRDAMLKKLNNFLFYYRSTLLNG